VCPNGQLKSPSVLIDEVMDTNMNEKEKQLGIPYGTASQRLRKSLMFYLAQKCNMNICYQCGKVITSKDELSIEHKVPWLHNENAKELFFSIDNIAFSHIKCNVRARRTPEINTREKNVLAYTGKRIGGSGFKGVVVVTGKRYKYQSYIYHNGKNVHIKYGDDPVELAKLYDKKAIELQGDNAVTNRKLGLL